MMEYWVNYTIDGEPYQAGPYNYAEILEHYFDIQGYARVTNCEIVKARDPARHLMTAQRQPEQP